MSRCRIHMVANRSHKASPIVTRGMCIQCLTSMITDRTPISIVEYRNSKVKSKTARPKTTKEQS
jgi:hypothetical protein